MSKASVSRLPTWDRPHFLAGGENPRLFYKVHGSFSQPLTISANKFRSDGVPEGCDLRLIDKSKHPETFAFGLEDFVALRLKAKSEALFEAAASAPQCLILQGEIRDPPTLNYFRDAVGLLTALAEEGTAIFDPFVFEWWSPAEWRERAFEPGGPVPRHHVVILNSNEEDDADDTGPRWYHTRGMLKFGRPDISVHNVPKSLWAGVEDLCNRFIEQMALGALVDEGQPIRVAGLPAKWRCHHAGDLEDPDFNNAHLEIG